MARQARRGHMRGSRRFAAGRAQRKGKGRRSVLWAGPDRRARYIAKLTSPLPSSSWDVAALRGGCWDMVRKGGPS